ncbi:C40 family peptidase [Zoogloea sp.]|jgi:cell wall-associated NlpC family hydrolase|uniref:C40 family peptidase n=1 Tax=Zoogloea sp. TaxID=49181 RepID=UPI0035B12AC3
MQIKKTLLGFLMAITCTCSSVVMAAEPPAGVADEAPAVSQSFFARYTDSVKSLVDRSFSLLGVPYRFGSVNPLNGLDCSGFVGKVFTDALGLSLPRTAAEMAQTGEQVNRAELKPGDLVFFNTMRRTFSHVGIYLGNNQFVHAPSQGGVVRVDDMRLDYWAARYNGARRVLPTQGQAQSN